jgi:hypothetical protein
VPTGRAPNWPTKRGSTSAARRRSPGWSTSNAGAPRGGGRTALTAAWIALINDDAALRQRMDERMDRVYFEQWAGRTLPPTACGRWRSTIPTGALLQGSCRYWNPWQDAMAAVGFGAHHRVTGNPKARELAEALAINVVQHGWLLDDTRQRGRHGDPLARRRAAVTAEQWLQPPTRRWWRGRTARPTANGRSAPSRSRASPPLASGDEALAAKCAEIQRRMRAGRRPPREGGPDRFGEWDAVQWQPAGK